MFLHENHGDISPADIICSEPGIAANAPSTQTVDINCQEKDEVIRVVYSSGNITAIYWSSPRNIKAIFI